MGLKKISQSSQHYVLCKQDERQFIPGHKVMWSPIADGILSDAPRRAVIENITIAYAVRLMSNADFVSK
jgi:hypothetical protein